MPGSTVLAKKDTKCPLRPCPSNTPKSDTSGSPPSSLTMRKESWFCLSRPSELRPAILFFFIHNVPYHFIFIISCVCKIYLLQENRYVGHNSTQHAKQDLYGTHQQNIIVKRKQNIIARKMLKKASLKCQKKDLQKKHDLQTAQ